MGFWSREYKRDWFSQDSNTCFGKRLESGSPFPIEPDKDME